MPDPLFSLKTSLAGRYKIEREIGAGGMATVYRAQDLRHDRPVAVKVLRSDLAAVIGVDRFLAEIKTTANLQHAHILGLIDSGEVDGTVFYVMPFVDGESLRAKLTREKQIPIPEAVRIATAVAGALDYAHRRGVIHRDIKPENILLHEGQPLVADFGIALAMTRSGSAGTARAGSGSRMTESGMSLGTPQYMSPEQAAGERNLDARTDIYALGCVLYEMLTGEPPFSGPTAQAIIAKVMTVEPEPVTTLRRSVPANVAAATMTALHKVPADRFATAAEFAAALANPQYVSPEVAAKRAASRFARFSARDLAAATAILALGIVAVVGWMRHVAAESGVVARFEIQYDATTFTNNVHLSPDGSQLVWSVGGAYWSRRLDSLGVKRLRDAAVTQGGGGIRDISPDGRDVLVSGGGRLSIASLTSGPPRELAAAGGRGGAAWASDGHIYFAFGSPDDPKRGIARVAASGGAIDTIATINDGSFVGEIVPLPGGRGLVVVRNYVSGVDSLAAVDVRSGKWTTLAAVTGSVAGGQGGPGGPGGPGGAQVQYVSAGYLLFANAQYIMAAPFDAQRLAFTQPPAPFIDVTNGVTSLTANANVLVYRVGPDPQGDVGIELRPLTGPPRALPNVTEAIQFGGFAVSSDGKRFVATGTQIATTGSASQPVSNLYVYQLPIGPMQRFRSDDRETSASWIPDTRNFAFVHYESHDSVVTTPGSGDATKRDTTTITIETSTLMRRPWDGTAAPESILAQRGGRDTLLGPSSWLSSTRAIVQVGGVRGANGGGRGRGGPARGGGRGAGAQPPGAGGRGGGPGQTPGGDLMMLSVGRPSTMRPFIKTDAPETNPAVSPNGRLLAYQSNTGTRTEVYVSPIDGSARVQVSLNGGTAPRWSSSGNLLYFRVAGAGAGADTLYSARILGTADPSVADIKPVLAGASLVGGYAPLPGDSLFLMRPAAADAHRPFIVVLNFVQELDRLFAKK